MAANLEILLSLKDEASAQLQQANTAIKEQGEAVSATAIAWKELAAAVGMAVAASALAIKAVGAFEEDRIASDRVALALRNQGLAYGELSSEIDSTLEHLKTISNFSKAELYEGFGRLVTITGNYSEALQNIGLVANVAAYLQMDLVSAARAVGLVLEGNYTMLRRQFGLIVAEGTAPAEVIDILNKKMEGFAQTSQSQFASLRSAWHDLWAAYGKEVAPAVETTSDFLALFMRVAAIVAPLTFKIDVSSALKELPEVATQLDALATIVVAPTIDVDIAPAMAGIMQVHWALDIIEARSKFFPIPMHPGWTAQPAVPSVTFTQYQYGGVVAGPIGQPVPIIAHGGERFLGAGGGGGGGVYVTVNVAGSIKSDRDIANVIRREVLLLKDRNVNAGLA